MVHPYFKEVTIVARKFVKFLKAISTSKVTKGSRGF